MKSIHLPCKQQNRSLPIIQKNYLVIIKQICWPYDHPTKHRRTAYHTACKAPFLKKRNFSHRHTDVFIPRCCCLVCPHSTSLSRLQYISGMGQLRQRLAGHQAWATTNSSRDHAFQPRSYDESARVSSWPSTCFAKDSTSLLLHGAI